MPWQSLSSWPWPADSRIPSSVKSVPTTFSMAKSTTYQLGIPRIRSMFMVLPSGQGLFVSNLLHRHSYCSHQFPLRVPWPQFRPGHLDKAEQGGPLTIVCDQIMSPTWSVNLSQGLLQIIRSGNFGTYHLTDQTNGGISRYEFGTAAGQGITRKVLPISCQDLKNSRPAYSVWTTATRLWPPVMASFLQEALEQFLGDQ